MFSSEAFSGEYVSSKAQNGVLSLIFIFLVSRLIILSISLVGYHQFQLELEPEKTWGAKIEEVWAKFDVPWYKNIALHGYDDHPFSTEEKRNWAFLPLYPMLVRTVLALFPGANFFFVGSMLSCLLSFGALYLIGKVFQDRIQDQSRFLFLYLISAGSFYLSIPYSESLALFLLAATFYFTQKKWFFWAGLMAGLGAITRIQSLSLIVIPLIPLLLNRKFFTTLGMLVVFCLPIAAYMAVLNILTGNPLAFLDMQQAWGNVQPYPVKALVVFLSNGIHNNSCQWLHFLVWSFFIACFVRNIKRIPFNEILFCIIVFLISTGTEKFWGAYRYVLMLIPLYIALSNEEKWMQQIYIYGSLIIGAIYIITFTNNNGFAI
jgi:Gpi18-like mannosyltransferase